MNKTREDKFLNSDDEIKHKNEKLSYARDTLYGCAYGGGMFGAITTLAGLLALCGEKKDRRAAKYIFISAAGIYFITGVCLFSGMILDHKIESNNKIHKNLSSNLNNYNFTFLYSPEPKFYGCRIDYRF